MHSGAHLAKILCSHSLIAGSNQSSVSPAGRSAVGGGPKAITPHLACLPRALRGVWHQPTCAHCAVFGTSPSSRRMSCVSCRRRGLCRPPEPACICVAQSSAARCVSAGAMAAACCPGPRGLPAGRRQPGSLRRKQAHVRLAHGSPAQQAGPSPANCGAWGRAASCLAAALSCSCLGSGGAAGGRCSHCCPPLQGSLGPLFLWCRIQPPEALPGQLCKSCFKDHPCLCGPPHCPPHCHAALPAPVC